MATLTNDQLSDIQGDLGIGSDESVFTDDDLNRLYTRADGDYTTAVYLGYRQLLAQANKLHDYTVAQTRMSKAQVREHLRDMLAFWQNEARVSGDQVRILGANSIPPRWKDKPSQPRRKRRPLKDWSGWS